MALILAGVTSGDFVLCSTLTFVGSANPIKYISNVFQGYDLSIPAEVP